MRCGFALCLLVGGCYDDSAFHALDDLGASNGSTSSSGMSGATSELPTSSTGATAGVTGSGGGSSDSSTGGFTTEASPTSDGEPEPLGPPTILDFALAPDPIAFNGPIGVTIWAADADGVEMSLGGGVVRELDETEPGVFFGEILALTGLANGEHQAHFTPWRENIDGEAVIVPYTIALPVPGTEGFWETSEALGNGQTSALGVLPSGDLVEFGARVGDNGPRCYLRRRDKGGAWEPADLLQLLPDVDCRAIDLEVRDDGAIFLLMDTLTNSGWRWSLREMELWGGPLKSLGSGNAGEVVAALAISPSGEALAVCGSAPTAADDLSDAMVRVFREELPGQGKTFDYVKDEVHAFDEDARGCVFLDEDRVVVVGVAYGQHKELEVDRSRDFQLVYELAVNDGEFVVSSGLAPQAVASDVAIDEQGRVLVVGYLCGDVCEPDGMLWVRTPEGEPIWSSPLGSYPVEALTPQAVRWSPAGYVVVASGGEIGNESAFTIRALAPSDTLWTYTHSEPGLLNLALALAIGPFGEVYAAGLGGNAYPAVAYIAG
ncbi:MAG: hypothetical protein KC486_28855 [Myxococcales bacterium]|nr:hypothetical protein [Myxococcales bacterium]